MRGYRIHRWSSEPVWEEIPDPMPAVDEVSIEVEACGVGLTVLNCINGDLSDDPALLPRVPGHELVGRVVGAGPGAGEPLVGRRVVAYFYLSCGSCPACRAGTEPLCSKLAGWVGVHRDGGYAPKAVLPSRNVIPIPGGVNPVDATVIPDAVATPIHVGNRADITPGDRVVVLGAGGGVGIHMVQVARHRGAEVAGFEIVDEKLAQIDRLGAIPVDSRHLAAVDPLSIFGAGRPTVVIDLLGVPGSMEWAIDGLAAGGRMVALTTFRDRPAQVESRSLVFGELSVHGSRYASRHDVAEAAILVAAGGVAPVIGAIRGPAEVLEVHEMLRGGQLTGRGALDWRLP